MIRSTEQPITPDLQALCRQHGVFPLQLTQDTLLIAVAHNPDPQRDAQLRFACGRQIQHQLWPLAQLESVLTSHYHPEPESERFDQQQNPIPSEPRLSEMDPDSHVVHFLDHILQSAIQQRASDIHFEPGADSIRIRLRVDGVLQNLTVPAGIPAAQLSARLKIIAELDIAERRLPQDGMLTVSREQHNYPMRISTLPTQYGEKVVLRLQESDNRMLPLEQLGLSHTQLNHYLQTLHSPQGFVLVTGPTGSGKTLTLYGGLKKLNSQQRNICSVEDPIEMPLEGINQTAINAKIGLTFSRILRALLRQDPDVIMIGEIRDRETAEIAVKAAHTGHLVLSTLHTNSACEALIRLENMGLHPYMLASSLKLVIAQRLVRLLCSHCKQHLPSGNFVKHALWSGELQAWQATGCQQCIAGYYGRTGIYEILIINTEIQQCLLDGGNIGQLEQLAQQQGQKPLMYAGLNLVNSGQTSLEELHRILGNS